MSSYGNRALRIIADVTFCHEISERTRRIRTQTISQWEAGVQRSILFETDAGQRLFVAVHAWLVFIYSEITLMSELCGRQSVHQQPWVDFYNSSNTPVSPPQRAAHGLFVWEDSIVHISTWLMRASPQQWQHHHWGWKRHYWCKLWAHLPRRHISLPFLHNHELTIRLMQIQLTKETH